MLKLKKAKSQSECGATIVEYAFALSVFLVIFILAGVIIFTASEHRKEVSMETVEGSVPCADGGVLSGDECL